MARPTVGNRSIFLQAPNGVADLLGQRSHFVIGNAECRCQFQMLVGCTYDGTMLACRDLRATASLLGVERNGQHQALALYAHHSMLPRQVLPKQPQQALALGLDGFIAAIGVQ